MLRSASFMVQRYLLGRHTLLARVPQFGLEMRVPARDTLGRNLFMQGVHAPEVSDFIATTLEIAPGELVFDIGAGVGWHTLLLARLLPRDAEIHAFEPDPWARGLLQENASRNRVTALTVVDAALGERSGAAELHRNGSRRRDGLFAATRADALPVAMLSLDDYCRRNGLAERPLAFIKLGVQGFEHDVLRGARETLARCRALLMEYAPGLLDAAGTHPAVVLDLLVAHGFNPAIIEPDGARAVTRAEILAADRACNLWWRRPGSDPDRRTEPPDPAVLGI